MDSIRNKPVLIYDDKCSSCTIFAKYAFKYSRGQIDCIGHYSEDGQEFRKLIFPPNYNETEMFWIITSNRAYGGRSGLLLLLGLIIKGLLKRNQSPDWNLPEHCLTSQMCNNNIFKIIRLYDLLKNGKKLNIKYIKSIKD
jgi:hypothetical protein